MSVITGHSVAKYFSLPFNEVEIEDWAKAQREALAGPVTFGQLFIHAPQGAVNRSQRNHGNRADLCTRADPDGLLRQRA